MKFVFVAELMLLCTCMCLKLFMRIDRDHGLKFSARVITALCVGSIAGGSSWMLHASGRSWMVKVCWFVLSVYFLSCAIIDQLTCQIYDALQYPGIAAAVCLLVTAEVPEVSGDVISAGCSLILFAGLQYFIFMKLYGKADGMMFLISAVTLAGLGYDIDMFLIHMIISYLLLALVQGLSGNVTAKGKLKEPVPFTPYISVAFAAILFWRENGINI